MEGNDQNRGFNVGNGNEFNGGDVVYNNNQEGIYKTINFGTGEKYKTNKKTKAEEFKAVENKANLPAKIGLWTKIRNFLFSDIVVTATPAQEEFLNKVDAFVTQEVDFKKAHNFLFQEIKLWGKK